MPTYGGRQRLSLACPFVSLAIFAASAPLSVHAEPTAPRTGELRLDRVAVVELARERAPEVLRAQSQVRRAETQLVGAGRWATTNPTLQARAGPRVSSLGVSPDIGITGWLPVPLLWDRWRALDAATAGVQATERAVEVVRLSAVAMALDLYARVLHAKANLALAEDRSLLAQELLQTAVARRDAGDASQLEVELAEAERYASFADVSAGHAQLEDATQRLALALGIPTLAPAQVDGQLSGLRQVAPGLDDDRHDVIGQMLEHHPRAELAAAEERRARAARAQAATGWLPQLAVGAGYMYEEGAHVPSLGVRTTIPSFERGQAARAQADADVAAAQREVEFTGLALRTEVVRALRLQAHAEAAATTLETQSLPRANRALELADVSYAAGKSDINALLLVRRNALSIRAESLARQFDAALAANRVGLLLGVPVGVDESGVQKGPTQ